MKSNTAAGTVSTLISRPQFVALAGLCLFLMAQGRAGATLRFWTGAGGANANWNNSGNWSTGVLPVNGDDLVFNSGALNLVNTNNLLSQVNSITFLGSGYTVRGNNLTVTNGVSGQQTSGNNTIEIIFSMGAAQTFDCLNAGATQTYDGSITNNGFLVTFNTVGNITANATIAGAGGVTKIGSGTLLFQTPGDNFYTGVTRVNAGTLQLNVTGTTAVGQTLIIGDGSGSGSPTVRLLQNSEISDTASITNNLNGLLDLNGHYEVVGPITFAGGDVATGTSGNLQANGNFSVLASSRTANLSGNVSLNASPFIITVADGSPPYPAIFSANLFGGAGGVVISNVSPAGRYFRLTGSNSFTGPLTISGGIVSAENSYALGATNGGTIVANAGTLFLYSTGITNESLTLNAGTRLEAQYDCIWAGPITLNGDATIQNFTVPGLFDIQGQIGGAGNLTMITPGSTNRLSGSQANTFNGNMILLSGNFEFGKIGLFDGTAGVAGTVQIGGPTNTAILRYLTQNQIPNYATVTIYTNSVLDLNNFVEGIGTLIMYGATVNTGTGYLAMYSPGIIESLSAGTPIAGSLINGSLWLTMDCLVTVSNSLTFGGEVTYTHGFSKTGPADLYLTASNSYAGLTVVQQGRLWVENAWALGSTNSGTVVSNGASLVMLGSFGITNESLTLNGAGVPGYGALDSETGGTNLWVGPIVLNADSTLAPFWSGTVLRVIGPISGAGGFSEFTGSGTNGVLWLEGSSSNSYGGLTTIQSGALNLNKLFFNGAVPNNLFINNNSAVRLVYPDQINDGGDVYVASGGLLDCLTAYEILNTLRGFGTVNFGPGSFLNLGLAGGSSTFDGSMVGSGYPGGWALSKNGNGTFTLTGTNTYTSQTHVFGGTLVVNGYQPQSDVIVEGGSTLGGSGTVGNLSAAGFVSPGSSPVILTCSNLSFSYAGSNGTYVVQLSGRTAGSGYDQINVRGTNNLANATLTPTFAFTNPVSVGDQLIIINNDGADSVTGNFIGWPEGSTVSTPTGYKLSLTYVGGDGNDVAFNVLQIPGGSTGSAGSGVTAGNGNHAVDPNDCNNLTIVITNTTATKMTNVTAVLSTTTVGAAVTQPYSSFPDIPPNGTATNRAPFQLSSFPGMLCGTNILLQLSVFSASHGAFTFPLGFLSGEQAVVSNRYDVNVITNIPDVGSIESTNVVSGFVGPLSKVVVSLWLTHPVDSDLSMTLLAPNGSGITLTSGNGSGANFGSGCSPDSARTTFDDSAAASITVGSPPFLGSFRPQYSLSGLTESPANGNWRLRITDSVGGSIGALRCWSLALYGVTCSAGSGVCAPCLPVVTDVITTGDWAQTNRLFAGRVVAACGAPKSFPGIVGGAYHYKSYGYANTSGVDACVTVMISAPACNVEAAAYLDNFDYSNIANNYLGDSGYSTGVAPGNITSFSVTVPAGHTAIVVVNETSPGGGCAAGYTLSMSGLPCPPPTLNVQSLPPGQARLYWTNSAGGYLLESTPSLAPTNWAVVGTEPLVSAGNYNVTNATTATNQFYRLHKP
jgi:autotransporter-associated beta strand protein